MLATGGGAFMNPQTRALIKARAVSVWLKADVEVLARRVSRKDNRPLLAGRDPLETLAAQARDRYPLYAEADIAVETGDTLVRIAQEYFVELEDLIAANPQIHDPDRIYPGQEVYIPGKDG